MKMNDRYEKSALIRFEKDLEEKNPLVEAQDCFLEQVTAKIKERPNSQWKAPSILDVLDRMKNSSAESPQETLFHSIGTVRHIGNGVATLSGLPDIRLEELVVFPSGVKGMVLNLEREHVDVILLGPDQGIRGGDTAISLGRRLRVPVGMQYLGRTVNPLGKALDDKGEIFASEYRLIDRIAPGVIERAPVNEPLYTGTKLVDSLIPLGRGQRELILGDRQTGKTTIALDAILSQRGTDVKCIYVAIAQKKTSVVAALNVLERGGVMPQTTVIVASPDDPPALRYIAPYAGASMSEYFLDQGMDVLIVYDDLTKHADSYRELSLLLRRAPGREAYPGDIFYLHSRLLERACKLNDQHGGGSITALPIATTQKGNISAYIPTNLISITDGQIVLDTGLFNKGTKPAIDIGRSVSRVGGSAQEKAMKRVVGPLKLELSQFEEVARFAQFGTEVNETTQRQIERGLRLQQLLIQNPHRPVSMTDQVIQFYAVTHNYLDKIAVEDVREFCRFMITYIHNHEPQLVDTIKYHRELSEEVTVELNDILDHVLKLWDHSEQQKSERSSL